VERFNQVYLEFPEFYGVYFRNLLAESHILFFMSENPCPFASPAFEVTLSGLAGLEYLPLPAHPRRVPYLSSNLRARTTVFFKN
jgi:hypothetical protein